MHNEIEAQFLDVDKEKIRARLKELGAKLIMPEVLMRRVVFDTGPHSFARVRDENGKIVMTYKNISDDHSIMGTREINLVVDNYENAILMLKSVGLKEKASQESYRESWQLNGVELDIDTWPFIPTFLEIEGPSETKVWETAAALGFSRENAKFGSVDTTYQHYFGVDPDVVNTKTPEILFSGPKPSWVKEVDR